MSPSCGAAAPPGRAGGSAALLVCARRPGGAGPPACRGHRLTSTLPPDQGRCLAGTGARGHWPAEPDGAPLPVRPRGRARALLAGRRHQASRGPGGRTLGVSCTPRAFATGSLTYVVPYGILYLSGDNVMKCLDYAGSLGV